MPAAQLSFWFEFASTYSYPAALRVAAASRSSGVELSYKPFLLGPIFVSQGWQDSPFNIYPMKGRYMWRDLERVCESLELPLKRPTTFPRNGLVAARVALLAAREPFIADFVRAVYTANFAEDREISKPEVVVEILNDLGQNGVALLEASSSRENKEALRKQTEEATRLEIFGSPSFIVAGELFWGNDRLEQALAAARRSALP
jgi:2-hydroxychromene-2-carboxylate isomerase